MTIVDSLPPEVISRSTVEEIEEVDRVDGIYPVYDDRQTDLCAGFVIAISGTMKAVALMDDGWEEIDSEEYEENPGEGVPYDEFDSIQDLQQSISQEIADPRHSI